MTGLLLRPIPATLAGALDIACLDAAYDLWTASSRQRWLSYGEETITERLLLQLVQQQRWLPNYKIEAFSLGHRKTGFETALRVGYGSRLGVAFRNSVGKSLVQHSGSSKKSTVDRHALGISRHSDQKNTL
jgi:hypothetical protein